MEKILGTFMRFHEESEVRFRKAEQERWERERDMEDRRRRDDREHDARMMGMLASMLRPPLPHPSPYTGPRPDFEDDSNYPYYSQH